MHKTTWDNVKDSYTADGVLITPGLKVWNYDYKEDKVERPVPYGNDDEAPWFYTESGGIFDGTRMSVRRPW